MKIFMPSVHLQRTIGFALSLSKIGIDLYVAGPSFMHSIGIHTPYLKDQAMSVLGKNVKTYDHEEILLNFPDIVIVGREDAESDLFALVSLIRKTKPCCIMFYSGNFHSSFDFQRYTGGICTDEATQIVCRVQGVPTINFFPEFNFNLLPFVPTLNQPRIVLNSYIQSYRERYETAYGIYSECINIVKERFGSAVTIANFSGLDHSSVVTEMSKSSATLHIKDQEGFGWSVIESMSIGRPVLLHRGLSRHMSLENWSIEGQTAIYFSDGDQLLSIVTWMINNPEALRALQARTAKRIREIYCHPKQEAMLLSFFNLAISRENFIWTDGFTQREGILKQVGYHVPCYSPLYTQGFQLWHSFYHQSDSLDLPASAFQSTGRYKENGKLDIDTEDGALALVWGPYISLYPGRYSCYFKLSAINPLLRLDVSAVMGNESVQIACTDTSVHGEITLKQDFIVSDGLNRIEFRVLMLDRRSCKSVMFMGVRVELCST